MTIGFEVITVSDEKILLNNLDKVHTTKMGVGRIKKNLNLEVEDVVLWCCDRIKDSNSKITRAGKNWYVEIDGCVITVNAHSYTIITAHKLNGRNG